MKKLIVFGIAAVLAAGAFAEEEDGHVVLYGSGGGGYWSGSIWAEAKSGAKKGWQDDAVGVLYEGNINRPQNAVDLRVYKIRWESSGSFMFSGAGRLLLGAGGLELVVNMNFNSTVGNVIHLTDSQTWRSSSDSARTVNIFGATEYLTAGGVPVFSAADDVELTLGPNLTWAMQGQIAFDNADIMVGSSGKLAISNLAKSDTRAKIRTLTVDGSTTSTIVLPSGEERLQIGTLKLRNGGQLSVSHSTASLGYAADEIAGKIVADAGAGTLAGKLSGGTAAVEIEVAEGAKLTLAPTWAGDPTEVALTGAGTVVFGGSGVAPVITSVEGFTGTIEMAGPCAFADGILEALQGKVVVSANATLQVDYPKTIDASKFEIASGKTLTLRYVSPKPPVAYADGLTPLTGLASADLTGWDFAWWKSYANAAYPTQDATMTVAEGRACYKANVPARRLVSKNNEWSSWADEGDTATHAWIDGAQVVSLENKNSSFGKDIAVGGVDISSFTMFLSGTGYRFLLGAGGLVQSSSTDFKIWQMDEFRLYAPQTWTATGGTVNLGDSRATYYAGRYPTLFTADPDANLTLSNSFTVAVNCPGDFGAADVILAGGGANLTLDQNRRGDRAATLNARKLQIGGKSTVTVRSDYRVTDGYTIAKKVVFVPDGANTPTLAFDTAYGTDTPLMDVGSIETSGTGGAAISGGSRFGHEDVTLTLAEGTTLACSATFANAQERIGALKLSGSGTWRVATASDGTAPVFTADSVECFSGTVVVANKGKLCLSGAVDFPALVLESGAVVRLKLDRGDRIVNWSKVTFPASGTVTLSLYRTDPIAAGEGLLDLNMDLSGVSPEDRAKIAIVVDDKQPSASPYTVTATPSFDENGNLFAALSAKMSMKNGTNGVLVWLGRDWGDASDVTQWAIFPQNAEAASFDPANHPTSFENLQAVMSDSGIYGSMSWKLDLRGLSWTCSDSRSNSGTGGAYQYGVSNGTFYTSVLMLGKGTFDVERGTTFCNSGFRDMYFSIGSNSTKSNPFLFHVHGGAVAEIVDVNKVQASLYNVKYLVDEGGSLLFRPRSTPFVQNARATFENVGALTFPRGFTATAASVVTGGVDIVQKSGVLGLAGAFEMSDREVLGPDASCCITFEGGTAVLSNGVSFVNWDLLVADGANLAIEIPKDGDFTMADFAWGANVALEKTGEGILRLAAADNVDSAAVTVSKGAVAGDCVVGGLVFAGGALGADAEAVGGLTVTNGTVSGTCRVRQLVKGSAAVPFLTVAAENDPGYTSENVVFENAKGKAILGKITKESVTVGDVECVRYSAEFIPNGLLLLVR